GRLVGAYLIPTLVLLGGFGYAAHYVGRRLLDEELGKRLIAIAQAAATQVLPQQPAQLVPGGESSLTYAHVGHKLSELRARTGVARIQLLDGDLAVRADTQDGVPIGAPGLELVVDRTEIARALASAPAASVLFRGRDGLYYKRGYAPVLDETGRPAAVIAVQGSAESFAQLGRF